MGDKRGEITKCCSLSGTRNSHTKAEESGGRCGRESCLVGHAALPPSDLVRHGASV